MNAPQDQLRLITNDLRLVALVLILLGLLTSIAILNPLTETQIVGGLGFLLLLLPGVWFAVASFHIRGGSLPVVRWSIWIACGQVFLVLLCFLVALSYSSWTGRDLGILIIPAGLLCFFLPAEVVLVIQLLRAGAHIRAQEKARGFEIGEAVAVAATKEDLPVAMPADERGTPDDKPHASREL